MPSQAPPARDTSRGARARVRARTHDHNGETATCRQRHSDADSLVGVGLVDVLTAADPVHQRSLTMRVEGRTSGLAMTLLLSTLAYLTQPASSQPAPCFPAMRWWW